MANQARQAGVPKGAAPRLAGEKKQKKAAPGKKLSEYGKQLYEKQKVRDMYGMAEKQFRRFFHIALKQTGATGENLLSLLERRLDNVVYRLKMAKSRKQSRQMVVHGHILVNGKRVDKPSCLINIDDVITVDPTTIEKRAVFVEGVIDKRMNIGVKLPEWLELQKKDRKGVILRLPLRSDVTSPIEENLIVEFYSK